MTKEQQYYEYLNWGGTMTMDEWVQDGRFDKYLATLLVVDNPNQ